MLSGTTVLGTSLFAAEPDARWRLPRRLREISGLAVTPDGRVMGHDDELAAIYEIDIETGRTRKRFTLGDPPVSGDFEGLAIDPAGTFYLATSTGWVFRFREGEDRGHVPFESFDTGLARVAEVEGAAFADERLILACKTNYEAALQSVFALHSWSPAAPANPARPWLTVPVYAIAQAVGARAFHPSGLEIDPASGRLIVVAARENALVELDKDGVLLAARSLGKHHRRAEGVTVLASGALAVAEEGGEGHAHISRYPRLDA